MPVLKLNRMSRQKIAVDILAYSSPMVTSKEIYNGISVISKTTKVKHIKSHIILSEPSGLNIYGFSIVKPLTIFFIIVLNLN
jgi:uncharacterized membrane protein YeiH